MKHARVVHGGAIHDAVAIEPVDGVERVRLADGRERLGTEVAWLPPFPVGTIIALGLNYADHAKELAFNSQEEPLVFLKGPNAVIGHRGFTRRPADATFMHYECELGVVIGRTARRVKAAQALDVVAGYCVANDYAIRDYLENWYRPNLRTKNRDTGTVIGPWLVDRDDIADPQALGLRTRVNGQMRQQGSTADMIFPVAWLIEYLSAFMTLAPGDVILTGTPEGVVDVHPGDEVVTEIDGVGTLINTIADDAAFGR